MKTSTATLVAAAIISTAATAATAEGKHSMGFSQEQLHIVEQVQSWNCPRCTSSGPRRLVNDRTYNFEPDAASLHYELAITQRHSVVVSYTQSQIVYYQSHWQREALAVKYKMSFGTPRQDLRPYFQVGLASIDWPNAFKWEDEFALTADVGVAIAVSENSSIRISYMRMATGDSTRAGESISDSNGNNPRNFPAISRSLEISGTSVGIFYRF